MADQTIHRDPVRRSRAMPRFIDDSSEKSRPSEKKMSYLATLDIPLVLIVGLLLALGSGMVFSTTFNYSLVEFGSSTAFFLQRHMRNVGLAFSACVIFALVD